MPPPHMSEHERRWASTSVIDQTSGLGRVRSCAELSPSASFAIRGGTSASITSVCSIERSPRAISPRPFAHGPGPIWKLPEAPTRINQPRVLSRLERASVTRPEMESPLVDGGRKTAQPSANSERKQQRPPRIPGRPLYLGGG